MEEEEAAAARSLLSYAVTAGLVCSSLALPRGIPAPPPPTRPPLPFHHPVSGPHFFFLSGNERKQRVPAFLWNDNDRASGRAASGTRTNGGAGDMCATVSEESCCRNRCRFFFSFLFVPPTAKSPISCIFVSA